MASANTSSAAALSETEFELAKHIIDIDVLEELSLAYWSIYKVPHNLRKVKQEAYTPELISIGPIHLGKQELQPMQQHKTRYFHFFYERLSQFNQQSKIKHYKHYLEIKEQEIRNCYAEKFPNISKERFLETILLDAVFIMELLLRNSSWKSGKSKNEHEYVKSKSFRWRHSDDFILTQAWLNKSITRDLILLENQIPFFVLMNLFETVVPEDDKKPEHESFLDLALEYFSVYDNRRTLSSLETKPVLDQTKKYHFVSGLLGDIGNSKKSDKSMGYNHRFRGPKHFTDLIRFFYLPKDINANNLNNEADECILKTATMLYEAGVSFEKLDHKSLLDIKLDQFETSSCLPCLKIVKSNLQIPQLRLDQNKEDVFRNLMALELCHYSEQPFICNYVSLLDSLINTEEDVKLLVNKEIIVHKLRSNAEIANMINDMSKNVVVTYDYFGNISRKLNGHYHYGNRWKYYMGVLKSVYFSDPWRASSTVVGVVFFFFGIISFLQLVGLYNPKTSSS